MLKDGEKGAVLQRDKESYAIVPHFPLGLVSPAELRKIADIAEKYDSEIALLTVIPTVAFSLVGPTEEELQERAEKLLAEALDTITKEKPNLKVTTKTHIGRPAEKIVETCIDDSIDLIVIGGEGLGGIKERILGSVSDKVAHTAPCPVTIIK